MKTTYRAMQISRPGVLELVERAVPQPGVAEVLIRVEACGICGADAADIERTGPATHPPRVPGHEVVGRILAMGPGTPSIWTTGQRVGVGRLGGHCGECMQCRQGRFQLCLNQPVVGATVDGGYAEMMLARSTGLVAIPDALGAEEAAPILCAGIATFNALKKCGAQAGDTVAIVGIGGLGHMALQYARNMGFRVVAIGRGNEKAGDALALGAHVYIDNRREDAAARLKAMGGAQAMVTMIDHAEAISALLPGLAPEGRLVVLNPARSPLHIPPGLLVGGQRSILGSLTGTPYDNEKTLNFSMLANVRPRIETMPLEQAAQAYAKMKSGSAKYRMVLTMDNPR
ncbi:alcohol dehydrogenase [Cupriavidus taiwanensis]|uniref:Alcohol dehydrogenase GroES domain protein n=1 Tax=Cupriavidus taiwanensis TaxID=164546 RepID=A0A7Z7JFS3_9BURK|nr:alcohol dehydrogenase [Cupriavidus taiwanensis]SOZ09619.1 Alcohol dehydrogenase GroES domain protein [Cupriavidus taiwanensis]SOZ11740.1 Alcohol dehydrogenase GroES domain protein [Cupriavidus taiwanensis]SOZ43095.1 Alcohol dehydrogenase GroES domain protein [Cupriavidus taiwanensis]SPC22341.1 Alcohol dehydrogenase GroES domain protein [Cupriavidus taiwanensis]SPD53846.1 Alcohol dehydrogenase [Cupriavidus taiwanensis]